MGTGNKGFPIGIKAGSSAVKLYKVTKASGEYFRVCYDGRRQTREAYLLQPGAGFCFP